MKNLIFSGYPTTTRGDIVGFSPLYKRMETEIKLLLSKNDSITLCLGRISDTGVSVTEPIDFFNIIKISENVISASYYKDHFDQNDEKIPIEKTIRFDNPFGEIPVLPGYEQLPKFFLIGEGLDAYKSFIRETRKTLSHEVGNNIQLCYKNDDGSFSVISGTLLEVNKGNILVDDYHEVLVIENKTVKVDLLSRKKNHRFISEAGFLFKAGRAFFTKHTRDEGEVFGNKPSWCFVIEKEKVA